MIKFTSSLGVFKCAKLVETASTPVSSNDPYPVTHGVVLGLEDIDGYRLENSRDFFYAASSLCYPSSTVFAGEVWRAGHSVSHEQMVFNL